MAKKIVERHPLTFSIDECGALIDALSWQIVEIEKRIENTDDKVMIQHHRDALAPTRQLYHRAGKLYEKFDEDFNNE